MSASGAAPAAHVCSQVQEHEGGVVMSEVQVSEVPLVSWTWCEVGGESEVVVSGGWEGEGEIERGDGQRVSSHKQLIVWILWDQQLFASRRGLTFQGPLGPFHRRRRRRGADADFRLVRVFASHPEEILPDHIPIGEPDAGIVLAGVDVPVAIDEVVILARFEGDDVGACGETTLRERIAGAQVVAATRGDGRRQRGCRR